MYTQACKPIFQGTCKKPTFNTVHFDANPSSRWKPKHYKCQICLPGIWRSCMHGSERVNGGTGSIPDYSHPGNPFAAGIVEGWDDLTLHRYYFLVSRFGLAVRS